jgi:hypothetical protein
MVASSIKKGGQWPPFGSGMECLQPGMRALAGNGSLEVVMWLQVFLFLIFETVD